MRSHGGAELPRPQGDHRHERLADLRGYGRNFQSPAFQRRWAWPLIVLAAFAALTTIASVVEDCR
jgi:hypothetical protein